MLKKGKIHSKILACVFVVINSTRATEILSVSKNWSENTFV